VRVGTENDIIVKLVIKRPIFGTIQGTSGVAWEQQSRDAKTE
jgi:hypothetical protein